MVKESKEVQAKWKAAQLRTASDVLSLVPSAMPGTHS